MYTSPFSPPAAPASPHLEFLHDNLDSCSLSVITNSVPDRSNDSDVSNEYFRDKRQVFPRLSSSSGTETHRLIAADLI